MIESASEALQIALIAALKSDAVLAEATGGRIYDNPPVKGLYPMITLGPAQELNDDAECIDGAECYQQIDIWSQDRGSQLNTKRLCGMVRRALKGAELDLPAPYALVLIDVERCQVISDPDGKMTHGIVNVRALVEEI